MKVAITNRLKECGLELHPEKTKVVYCRNSNRKGTYPVQKFDFSGYGFRPRSAKNNKGQLWVSFSPAVSDDAAKKVRRHIKAWKLRIHNNKTLSEIAVMINHVVRGWINYYCRFHKSRFYFSLKQINDDLVKWARWKYKKLRRNPRRARRWLANVARRQPDLFVHWGFGVKPVGWASGAG
jgi:RNA-directed DNA polymerase